MKCPVQYLMSFRGYSQSFRDNVRAESHIWFRSGHLISYPINFSVVILTFSTIYAARMRAPLNTATLRSSVFCYAMPCIFQKFTKFNVQGSVHRT